MLLGAHGGDPFGWAGLAALQGGLAHVNPLLNFPVGEAGHYQACRQAGEEASPDHGDSRDRITADPIDHGQARMCWLQAAFAVALDCAAPRTGESAPGAVSM
jgi:hypothetical protein